MKKSAKYIIGYYHKRGDNTSWDTRYCKTQKEATKIVSELKKDGKFDVRWEYNINY